jgi:2-polyprenyl-3-methyl-5-hydroxy-6-metoxy-1,4-benzoquinol methylase
MNTSQEMTRSAELKVKQQILQRNPWYISNQFEWAKRPCIRLIYEKRYKYFLECMERARNRTGPILRILDGGCGDGYWLSRLSAIPWLRLTGIDYNPLRIERAMSASAGASVHLCNLMNLQPEEPYDVVLLNQVIEHVNDDIGLLHKIRENLRIDGLLILGTPNEGSRLHRLKMKRRGRTHETDHVHFYTEREISRKLLNAGFRIESVMREVFAIPNQRIYYWLTSRAWGFILLEILTRLFPSECSDFYFECVLRGEGQNNRL